MEGGAEADAEGSFIDWLTTAMDVLRGFSLLLGVFSARKRDFKGIIETQKRKERAKKQMCDRYFQSYSTVLATNYFMNSTPPTFWNVIGVFIFLLSTRPPEANCH
jgi:hypothetical protein